MKVLHVVNWYPSEPNPNEGLWIKKHIASLKGLVEKQFVLHIEVKPFHNFGFFREDNESLIQRIFFLPINSWFIIEIMTALLLSFYLFRLKVSKKFDLINFHIAYPLLTYWHLIKKFVHVSVVITEHWSAYHFSFNVKKTKSLRRIKRIFQDGLPLIVVSKALKGDIQNFSCNYSFPVFVVPNVVSEEFINHSSPLESKSRNSFFMVSSWKWPKRPDVVINSFAKFLKRSNEECFLRIAGCGGLLSEMKQQVTMLGITDNVIFLGKLNSERIAEEMRQAIAFLHCSEYETFSVVCAEALCSGCPVIASKVGGITEFVNSDNGIWVTNHDDNSWQIAITKFSSLSFCRRKIAESAAEKFSSKRVGENYYKVLSQVFNGARK